MPNALAIGLNVNEREVLDTPVVEPPPIGQSGLVFRSRRGPVGTAVQLNNLTVATRVFGEPDIRFNAHFCMRGLFKNAGEGGARVYGARAIAQTVASPQPARVASTADPTYVLSPGQTVTIDCDGGGPDTATFNATAAAVTGVGASFPTAAPTGLTLIFNVDNGSNITVTFQAGDTTLLAVLARINAAGTGYAAVDNGGQVEIISDRLGTSSEVEIVGGTHRATLGLSIGTTNGTGNVANIRAVTAAEVDTVLTAAVTNLNVVILGSGRFQLESTATGVAGEVDITGGTALTALGLLVATTNGQDATGAGPVAANTTFNRSATAVWTFTAGYRGYEDPGTWANGAVFIRLLVNPAESTQRDVEIYYQGPRETVPTRKEFWEGLDANSVVAKLNSPTGGSEYVIVNIEGGDTGVPDATAGLVQIDTDTSGTEGVATVTETDYETTLGFLNGLPIQIVANLDITSSSWVTMLEAYCSGRGDVLGVFQGLQGANIPTYVATYAARLLPKSFVAGYKSFCTVSDGAGGTIDVPVIGHVIGAGYVRKPRQRGNIPHVAPAGRQCALLDVLDVENSIYDQADLLDLVNGCNVNPVVFESGSGFFAKTSRTMSTLNKHVSIHVRLLTNYIKVAFKNSLGDFEQENNTPDTRRQLRNSILRFMTDLDGKGAFETEGGFENNVAVVCDGENNTQAIIQQRRMVCDVTFRPSEIAEDVQINLIQTRDGLLVQEAA